MAMVSLGCSFSIFSTQPESGLEYQKTHSVGKSLKSSSNEIDELNEMCQTNKMV